MAAAIPYIAMAVAAYASKRSTDSQADQQKHLNKEMLAYKTQQNAPALAATDEALNTLTPEARVSANERASTGLVDSLRKSIASSTAYQTDQPFEGKISSGFARQTAANKAGVDQRTNDLVRNLSIMGRPAETNLNNELTLGRAGGVISAANSAGQNVGDYYLQLINGIQPHAGWGQLSQAASGVAQGMAAKKVR